ncbi:MAG TPA: carbon-nitrogen hydrolase family protein [Phenylobacterium sp.]|nr:carbon-nitrogen hydrolase family protein [Phenylobacterium sp.]
MAEILRVAVGQSHVGLDHHENGREVRQLMRQAADLGAQLVQFPEGAISGYPSGEGKLRLAGWAVDWAGLKAELEETAELAAELSLWVAAGANHPLTPPNRPHNSLYVIDAAGRLAARYDKRLLSHTEVTGWYTPGFEPALFRLGGFCFGLSLCIEINFPELFLDYAARGAEVVLFSSFSEDPMFGVMAQAYAAATNCWFGVSVPAQCSRAMPSGVIGPNGRWLARCPDDGSAGLVIADLDRSAPDLDLALNKARPWRTIARQGEIYAKARVDDARSRQRAEF